MFFLSRMYMFLMNVIIFDFQQSRNAYYYDLFLYMKIRNLQHFNILHFYLMTITINYTILMINYLSYGKNVLYFKFIFYFVVELLEVSKIKFEPFSVIIFLNTTKKKLYSQYLPGIRAVVFMIIWIGINIVALPMSFEHVLQC